MNPENEARVIISCEIELLRPAEKFNLKKKYAGYTANDLLEEAGQQRKRMQKATLKML